jgi:hypothetical protein
VGPVQVVIPTGSVFWTIEINGMMAKVALGGQSATRSATVTTRAISGPIRVTGERLVHISENHTVAGTATAGKSIFFAQEDVIALIERAGSSPPVKQAWGGNFERVVDAGHPVGIDRLTGLPTSIYSVITKANEQLVTLFPGTP